MAEQSLQRTRPLRSGCNPRLPRAGALSLGRSAKDEYIMQESPAKADWLSFVLHFIFGLFVGCVLGFLTISRRRHGIWLQEELIIPYLSGTSLICAGLGAKLGDRLWIGDNYRVIPPSAPNHDRVSFYLSVLATVFGIGLAAFALFRHFFGQWK